MGRIRWAILKAKLFTNPTFIKCKSLDIWKFTSKLGPQAWWVSNRMDCVKFVLFCQSLIFQRTPEQATWLLPLFDLLKNKTFKHLVSFKTFIRLFLVNLLTVVCHFGNWWFCRMLVFTPRWRNRGYLKSTSLLWILRLDIATSVYCVLFKPYSNCHHE